MPNLSIVGASLLGKTTNIAASNNFLSSQSSIILKTANFQNNIVNNDRVIIQNSVTDGFVKSSQNFNSVTNSSNVSNSLSTSNQNSEITIADKQQQFAGGL